MVRDSDTHGGEEIDRRLADGWKGCSQRIFRGVAVSRQPRRLPPDLWRPTENALSMDSAEQRIVAFTAGSHGLVHTYELSIPISVDRVSGSSRRRPRFSDSS